MVRLEGIRKSEDSDTAYSLSGHAPAAVVDLQVSTVAELPAIGDTSLGVKIAAGSIAQCIQTGKFYTLDDGGTWYDQSGNAVV